MAVIDHSQLYPTPPLPFDDSKHSQISTLWIIFFCFVGGSLLLFCYYMILRKYRMNPNNLDRNLHDLQNTHEDLLDEDHGPVVNHPIWLINTVGLQDAIIESIAVFKYKKNEALVEGTDCSVCLNEFQEDESLRLLPKCSHAFHIPCIDTWLRSHKNCPVCRAPVVRENASVNFSEPVSNHVEETEQESVENHVEESGELNIGVEEVVERNLGNLDKRVLSDLVNYNVKFDAGFQRIRRSISMDCSSAIEGSSNTQMVNAKKPNLQADVKKSDSNLSLYTMMKSCSFGGSLRKGQVKMKRSFSSADKRHKNRYSKSHDSILPH